MKLYATVVSLVFLWAAQSAEAKTLRIAVGLSIPPYIIKEESRGIEYDILKEVLLSQGYEMEPVYVPLGRTLHMIKSDKVDGIMSTGADNLPGCYTDSHITYWNFAISLKSAHLKIESVHDLIDKSVLSFQNAKNYLGADFKQMAEKNRQYKEVADQSIQNKLLFNGRADVVVADRYIFEWFRNDASVQKVADTNQEVEYHRLFEPSNFRAVFKDGAICAAFNVGLKDLRESGRYQEIIASYNVIAPELMN